MDTYQKLGKYFGEKYFSGYFGKTKTLKFSILHSPITVMLHEQLLL